MIKHLLLDVDGVLLDWDSGFDRWMEGLGYVSLRSTRDTWAISDRYGIGTHEAKKMIHTFNNSSSIGFLSPFRDVVDYLPTMFDDHTIDLITSFSTHEASRKLRMMNLTGAIPGIEKHIRSMFSLPCGAPKENTLIRLRSYFNNEPQSVLYIDDSKTNVLAAARHGYTTIHMQTDLSRATPENMCTTSVATWAEIHNYLYEDDTVENI